MVLFVEENENRFVFKNVRHCVDVDALPAVRVHLVCTNNTYCIPIWGDASKTYLLPLERAQRAVSKTVLFKPTVYSTWKLYSEARVHTLKNLTLSCLQFVLQYVMPLQANTPITYYNQTK